jgi:hypothetical protein
MSMGLATIVTNFSGNVDFLTEENAYLIPIEGVEIIPRGSPYGDSPKKAWAVPSVRRLSQLMLHAWRNPEQTKTVGKRARRDIISQYSEEAVAELVLARVDQLVEIKNNAKSSREKLDNLLGNNDAHLLL